MFDRLGSFVSRHWALVLGGWVAVVLGVLFFAPRWDDVTRDGDFEYLPDYCSVVKGNELLADAFPQLRTRSTIVFVLSRPDGPLTEPDFALADRLAETFETRVSDKGPIVGVLSHRTEAVGEKLLADPGPNGQGLLVIVQLNTEFMAIRNMPLMKEVYQTLDEIHPGLGSSCRSDGIAKFHDGLQFGMSGSAAIGTDMRFANIESIRNTEYATVFLVIVILVLVYRAPGLVIVPLATVGVSVVTATGLVAFLAYWAGQVDWTNYMIFKTTRIFVVVILFGAGVDFCLFLISRYKEELGRGRSPGDAVSYALGRVGDALSASALTTIVGLGLMFFTDFGKFRNSGPTVALCLCVALLASLTLAPALLRAGGRIVFWPWGIVPVRDDEEDEPAAPVGPRRKGAFLAGSLFGGFWERLSRQIVRRPGLIFVGSLLLLAPIVYRGTSIEVTYDFLSELDADTTSVQGTHLLRRHFAAGQTGPVTMLAYDKRGGLDTKEARLGRIRRLTEALNRFEYRESDGATVHPMTSVSSIYAPLGEKPKKRSAREIIGGVVVQVNPRAQRYYLANARDYEGKVARFDLVFKYHPFSIESIHLLDDVEKYLHTLAADPESEWHGTQFSFVGTTAGIRDLRAVTTSDQWQIQKLVPLGVLAILILILRRPLISVYLICSVLVGYFVTLGVADTLFGWIIGGAYHGLDWKVPVFLFVILIAVGQDYNIYLATRVFEEQKRRGLDDGLRLALVRTGGIITSCGVIMAGTFASMMTGTLQAMRELGFALAFGVLLDTFVIRTILVPAFLIMWQRALARWGIVPAPVPEKRRGPAAAPDAVGCSVVPTPMGLGSGDGKGPPAAAASARRSAHGGSAGARERGGDIGDASTPQNASSRRWAPRMWLGCDLAAWTRLLARNRFAVGPSYWYIAAVDSIAGTVNTLLSVPQRVWYGRRIARLEIEEPPVFIIGHWRTGTTLLHELMALDPRNAVPTTYECFAPHHFLVTERVATKLLGFMMPDRRPMDNMAIGWDRPQEDEFALCILGLPSPYATIAFPNRGPQFGEYLNLEGVDPDSLERWKRTFLRFLKQVALRNPGQRLVVKSPPHTCRIKVIQELFPRARFVHLVRDPYVLFPSTVNLWKSLYRTHGLQHPTFEGLEEYVLSTFCKMHDRLEQTRPLVEPSRFMDLRYEDLVTDPVGAVRAVYEHLGLEGFGELRPRLEERAAAMADYQPNRYELTPEQRAEVGRRWAPYFQRYGYPMEHGSPANSLWREDVSCS